MNLQDIIDFKKLTYTHALVIYHHFETMISVVWL